MRNRKGQFVRRVGGIMFENYPVYFDRKGYALIYKDGKDTKLHVFIWERAHGKKPEGYEIHHIDGNKANYELSNLMLVSNIDHQRIHAGWIKENGEWVAKPCSGCNTVKPLSEFYKRGKFLNGTALCKKCVIEKTSTKNLSEIQKEKRRKYAREWARMNYKRKKEVLYAGE